MIINTIIFILYFNLFIFSTLGFGFLALKFFNLNRSTISFGLTGLIGLFTLTFIAYLSHLLFPHNYLHNIILHGAGFFFLIFFFVKDKKFFLPNLTKVLVLIISFILALFIAKNHEDFPFYHLPYTIQLVENKIQFGIGFLILPIELHHLYFIYNLLFFYHI